MTPEGLVKKRVSALLKSLGPECYYFMPVQSGYGATTLDYLGTYKGKSFAIETKAPGGKLTALQEVTIKRMEAAGIVVFVIVGTEAVNGLRLWFME